MSRALTFFLVALAAGLGTSACTSTYVMKVDSVTNPAGTDADTSAAGGSPATGRTSAAAARARTTGASAITRGSTAGRDERSYAIKSRTTQSAEDSLRQREAVEYVKKALASKGLFEAPSTAAAGMIVEVDYGLDSPRTTMEERLVPIYSKAGGGVRYEERIVTLPNGTTTTRTVPVYDPPGTRLVGEEWVIVPITTYEKYLKLIARENSGSAANPAQIWAVTVTSEDESNDLRKYVPILVSAAVNHIGESNGQTTVRLKDQSEEVAFIRGE